MKVSRTVITLYAAALLFSSSAEAAPSSMKLSVEEAVSLAKERNSSIKASMARIDQAEARVVQSRQAFLPKVRLSETFVRTTDPGAALVFKLQQGIASPMTDFMNQDALNHPSAITDFQTTIEVMQPLVNIDAMLGRSVATSAKKAQEFMTARAGETIELQVKKAWYGLLLAKKNLLAIDQSIATMKGYSAQAAKAYRIGLLTKSDKLSTEVRLAELKEQKLLIESEIGNAEDALRSMLNLDREVSIVQTGDLAARVDGPAVAEPADPAGRSDLKALAAYREMAGYQYEMARAQLLPRLNAFGQKNWHSASIAGGDGSNWVLGVSMQWNLFDGMATYGKIQEGRAQDLEARYSYEAAREQSELEAAKARRALVTSKERIVVAGKSLEEAKVSFDYIGEQFRTGMAMTFELLMREGAWTYARLRLNQAMFDYNIAKSELEYFTARR